MRITFVAAGRGKRDSAQTLFDTYRARCRWEISLKEVVARRGGNAAQAQAEENAALLAAVPERAVLVALDAKGWCPGSEGFAAWLGERREAGEREIAFAIGGADGLTQSVTGRAGAMLSLGAMTWPHMLVRAMLAEQIYRAQCILEGHPYHR